mgnify:CR=1 FL=1
MWWAHNQDVRAGGKGLEPLVVQAPATPARTKPENAGGLVPPNQDKEVYNRISPNAVAPGREAPGRGANRIEGERQIYLHPSGWADAATAAKGIITAAKRHAAVMNLSVGSAQNSPVVRKAIAYAQRQGVVVVAAAGNEAQYGDPVEYPAALLQPALVVAPQLCVPRRGQLHPN